MKLVDLLVLAMVAAHSPLGIMAANHWQVVHPERVIAMTVVVAALASVVAYIWVELGGDRRVVVFTVFVGTFVLMRGGPLFWRFGSLTGWLTICAGVGIAAYLGHRLVDSPVLRVVTVVLVVVVGSGPIINGLSSLDMGASQIVGSDGAEVDLAHKPDVFLVVLDGYPGQLALQIEFGMSNPNVTAKLRDAGFQVPASAWTPYWSTERAIPAILDMSYPSPAAALTSATVRDLHAIVAGDSGMMEVFRDNGYETTMLESGWVGSSCGATYDHCVPSTWFDELGFGVGFETALTQQLTGRGGPFSLGSLRTMERLKELAVAPRGERPRFVFGHVLSPHGPYLLNENCEIDTSKDRLMASTFGSALRDATVRNFLSQMACVDSFIVEFAELVDDEDVVVFVGDHGTEMRRRLLDGAKSDPAAVIGRMNVFVAAHVDPSCEIGDALVTANLMRRVFSCYSETPVPDVMDRMFLPDGYELSETQVQRLLEDGEFVS